MFVRNQCIFILYVDDAICLSPNEKDAQLIVSELESKGFILTDDGDLSSYLGIKVDKISKDEVKLSQPAFTKKIIEQVNLKDQR